MAISAYASALTLLQLIENMKLRHKYELLHVDIEQICCFDTKLHTCLDLLEKLPPTVSQEIKALAQRFKDRASEASTVIDRHVVDQICRRLNLKKANSYYKIDPEEAIQDIWKLFCSHNDPEEAIHEIPPFSLDFSNYVYSDFDDIDFADSHQAISSCKEDPREDIEESNLIKQSPDYMGYGDSDKATSSYENYSEAVIQDIQRLFLDDTDYAMSCFYNDLDVLIQEIQLVIQELSQRIKVECIASTKQLPIDPRPRSEPNTTNQPIVVGFGNQLQMINEKLLSNNSHRDCISIVGMGGSGKTTLARLVYEDFKRGRHFDKYYWITISQDYDIHKILQQLLDDKTTPEIAELGDRLRKKLHCFRYLIVLDDLWSIDAWEKLIPYFPENNNKSRIIVTTRVSTVADYLPSKPHKMNFLNEETSWELLRSKLFDGASCPSELEEIGKDIARKCRGLPISIVTIGGLLSKSSMKRETWMSVAENVTSLVSSEDDEHCRRILLLSYFNLPIHLKLCFLDLAKYREDDDIEASKLITSWIAGALVKPTPSMTIEETAHNYLNDLIERSLVFIRDRQEFYPEETLGIHDLLLDLCRTESYKEDLTVMDVPKQFVVLFCFLCGSQCYIRISPLSVKGGDVACSGRIYHQIRRVKRFSNYRCSSCLENVTSDTTLRRIQCPKYFPSSSCLPRIRHLHAPDGDLISKMPFKEYLCFLWNIQILKGDGFSEDDISWMPQLIKLKWKRGPADESKTPIVFEKARYLRYHCSLDESGFNFEESFPNLKKLRLYGDGYKSRQNLKVAWDLFVFEFPHSIKTLQLCDIYLNRVTMNAIGLLPNLEVFGMKGVAFEDGKWNWVEGEFARLQMLGISCCSIKRWRVRATQFPQIRVLRVMLERDLRIPRDMRNISTLDTIDAFYCGDVVNESAKQILADRHSYGDETFRLYFYNDDDDELLREYVDDDYEKEDSEEEEEEMEDDDFAINPNFASQLLQ